MRRTINALTSCLFALVITMTACTSGQNDPEAVAASFTSAWAEADFDKMTKLSNDNYRQSLLWQVSIFGSDEIFKDYVDSRKKQNWKFTQDGDPQYNGGGSVSIEYISNKAEYPDSTSRSIVGLSRGEDMKWEVAYFLEPQ